MSFYLLTVYQLIYFEQLINIYTHYLPYSVCVPVHVEAKMTTAEVRDASSTNYEVLNTDRQKGLRLRGNLNSPATRILVHVILVVLLTNICNMLVCMYEIL